MMLVLVAREDLAHDFEQGAALLVGRERIYPFGFVNAPYSHQEAE